MRNRLAPSLCFGGTYPDARICRPRARLMVPNPCERVPDQSAVERGVWAASAVRCVGSRISSPVFGRPRLLVEIVDFRRPQFVFVFGVLGPLSGLRDPQRRIRDENLPPGKTPDFCRRSLSNFELRGPKGFGRFLAFLGLLGARRHGCIRFEILAQTHPWIVPGIEFLPPHPDPNGATKSRRRFFAVFGVRRPFLGSWSVKTRPRMKNQP